MFLFRKVVKVNAVKSNEVVLKENHVRRWFGSSTLNHMKKLYGTKYYNMSLTEIEDLCRNMKGVI